MNTFENQVKAFFIPYHLVTVNNLVKRGFIASFHFNNVGVYP